MQYRLLKLESETKQLAMQYLTENPSTERVANANQQDAVPALMQSSVLLLKFADLKPMLTTIEDANVALWTVTSGLLKHLKSACADQPKQGS